MVEHDDILAEMTAEVDEEWRERFLEIVALIDPFCDEHLDEEYKLLSREMAIEVCVDDSPAERGKALSWAAAIVWTVGWVNFLSDKSFEPVMTCSEVAKAFGVSESNMSRLSAQIREGLDLFPFHPDWTLPSKLIDNPLAWLVETKNGFVIDARTLPREQQEELADAGIIPFVCGPEESCEPSLRLARS